MDAAPRIWREALAGTELRALGRSRALDWESSDTGRGLAVLLVPGLLAPDRSLWLLARYLKRHGFRPRRAGIASNVDCSEREMERLTLRLERAAATTGSRVAVVGHSRGGVFAQALAVRRPDLVAGIACLGSPLVDPLANIHPLLHLQLELIASLGDRRVPRLATHGCADWEGLSQLEELAERHALSRMLVRKLTRSGPGDCCRRFWADLREPFPAGVGYLSIWSRQDAVVSPAACLDPEARQREVRSSHCGMAWNVQVFRALLDELEALADAERGAAPDVAAPRLRVA